MQGEAIYNLGEEDEATSLISNCGGDSELKSLMDAEEELHGIWKTQS